MAITPDLEEAARLAANRVYEDLLTLMKAGKQGKVIAVIGGNEIKVDMETRDPRKPIKLIGSHRAVIEKAR